MTNFDATTSKQDAAYLHCHDKRDAHASRVRIIFPTIVRYEDNRWWFQDYYFLSSLSLSLSLMIDDGS